MQFALPESTPDTVEALRTLEAQAPKSIKAVMLQAANELATLKRAAFESAAALELAASLKAGLNDSDSRHQQVAQEVRMTLVQVANKLRAVS